jgi:uncharacterized protein
MTGTCVTVGVIADTHGLLRPEAIAALQGADLILHAGDVGSAAILDDLRAIAPTTAVRGNVDTGIWATTLPLNDVVSTCCTTAQRSIWIQRPPASPQ